MSFKKSVLGLAFVGTLAASSAFAQINNTGQITVQGVVPGAWEITVYDINSGYDFDLSQISTTAVTARVGTIHIYCNDDNVAGHLIIESANGGRLINSSSGPGIAAENQQYTFDLSENILATNNGVFVNTTTSTLIPLTTANTIANDHDLVVPATVDFDAAFGFGIVEVLYDVNITIPADQKPQASGVYTDTITFTIMDDG